MKRLLLLAFLACTTFAHSQTNLIQNGSLETWNDITLSPSAWAAGGNIIQNTTEFTDGTSSALFINTNVNPQLATNYNLEVGKTYQLSFDYKVKTANPSFGQQVIGYSYGGSDFTPNTNASRIPQNFDWSTVTTEITPTSSESWYLEISIFSFIADPFEVYIDNIEVVETGTTAQRNALVAFYNATGGAGWTNTWDLNADMSTWYGVTLDTSGNVQSLNLSSNNLSGTLPSEIGNLTNLRDLNLSGNQLSGTMPTELFSLVELNALLLSNNQLQGTIPSEIGNLTNLNLLELNNNKLTGQIPPEVGNLTSLESINLIYNQLNGNIPIEIGNLTKLRSLYFNNNFLSGEIPIEIGNMTDLVDLQLNENQLYGTIPSQIGNLTNLNILQLAFNQFSGSIPTSIGNLIGLTSLELNVNQLSGEIPTTIGNLVNLHTLHLYNNQLTGAIPAEIGNLSSLVNLSIPNNKLSGIIPAQIANISSLEHINLEYNQLSGVIPSAIKNLPVLSSLNLASNSLVFEDIENDFNDFNALDSFTYSPQSGIDNIEAIEVLLGTDVNLSVTGTTSANNNYQWRKNGSDIIGATNATLTLSNISDFDLGTYDCMITNPNVPGLTLYKNPISLINPVPQSEKDALIALYNATGGPNWTNTWDLNSDVGTWYGLTFNTSGYVSRIYLGGNNLIGTLPTEIGNFALLENLGLNGNQISGSIPSEIGNISNLRELDLANNQLTGEIPTEIGYLYNLRALNLYLNQLTGSIPTLIGNLYNLEDLRLGSNSLSGEIPVEIGNLTQLIGIDLSQNQLSGDLSLFMGLTNLISLDVHINKITGEIPNGIGNLSQLIFLQLHANELSGELPEGLFSLFNLQYLSISNNKLTGEIPATISNLGSLDIFNISYNNFSGAIPPELANLNSLESISINNNNFSGTIPSGIKNFSNLRSFRIGNNNFVFEDFENDFADYNALSAFDYAPQANIGTKQAIENVFGSSIVLTTPETQSINNSYQWRKDGVDLPGETNSSLTLSNISNSDLGAYDCIITNTNVPNLSIQKNVVSLINSIPQSEKDALIAFYNATGGPNWTNTWDLNSSPGSWHGLSFNTSGRVTTIDLRDNNLTGHLPAEIGDFSNLETLFLLFNQLSGTIPAEIGNLTQLKRLSFTGNQLTGTIPTQMGNMTSLERLFLNDNQLFDEIPIELGNLSNLEALSLINNRFTGPIPTQIGNLSQLTFLNLAVNKFSGVIPSQVGNLTGLQTLYLYDNEFTGAIPTEIGNLSNLRQLFLNKNQLSGVLPIGIKNITALADFDISENRFVFEDFEADFASLSAKRFGFAPQAKVDSQETMELIEGSTITLNVSATQSINNNYQWRKDGVYLPGENQSSLVISNATNSDLGVYDCIITNTSITDLALERNTISILDAATITQRNALIALYNATDGPNWTNTWDLNADMSTWYGVNLDGSGNVLTLILHSNNLTGTIPPEIGNLTHLVDLRLNQNNISGIFPPEIGNLIDLNLLFLDNNAIQGDIPSSIGNLSKLTMLSLGRNQLSGTIPLEIGNLTSITFLQISENQLTGSIPDQIGNLVNLESLDLGSNSLIGEIPPTISDLIKLRSLTLNVNQLENAIPSEIGNLTNLQTLYLNENQLSGPLPPEIGDLSSLSFITISNNEISGPIPTEIGNLTELETLYLDNNQLSGTIPTEIGDLTKLEALSLINNQLSGTIPTEIGNLTKLKALSLGNNQLSGTIPTEIGNLTSLVNLQLNDNQLFGILPSEIGNLTSLSLLFLNDNQLSSTLPIEMGNLTELLLLNLQSNQFTGIIPTEIGNLVKMQGMSLAGNQFTGTIPTSIGNLVDLELLFLDQNQFSGPIPASIANLPNLDHFRIRNNNFVFEDFENEFTIYNAYRIFVYSPQASIDTLEEYTIDEGGEITLTVHATSSNSNNYQWRKNGIAIPGANTNNYIISDSAASDIGDYDCIITNTVVSNLELVREVITINVNVDTDKDGVIDTLDQCPDTPSGDIVDLNGCSDTQLSNINFNDIQVAAISTSCTDIANGEISLSFEKDHVYSVSLTGNSENRSFTDISFSNGLIINDLNSGSYEVCVTTSDIPNFEQCYTVVIEAPESLKVYETKVDNTGKTAIYQVSGSTYYTATVNAKNYEFNFTDTGVQEIRLELQNGANEIEIKTDKACQGTFNKTLTNGEFDFYPIPAKDELNIAGAIESNTSIVMTNVTGTVVFTTIIHKSDTSYKIPLSNMATGMYIITITTPFKTTKTKIFKK